MKLAKRNKCALFYQTVWKARMSDDMSSPPDALISSRTTSTSHLNHLVYRTSEHKVHCTRVM